MITDRPSKYLIFHTAADLADPADRRAYLDEVCAGDSQLRREIDALLERDQKAGSFLESPPSGLLATVDYIPAEPLGSQIGPYKLLQQIGEGGMGVVYMSEQREPVKRRVALKIIKPGMDTRQVIARFEVERQALAMMDHPNIAKVLDAGATESGHPYFVMELVNGLPLTEYCDQQHLTTGERLGLFVSVCRAVQHAHQKGVIHRDLKPSNILVALYDGKPVPKVIDFGVAKATGHSLTDKTMFTHLGQVVGTLEYMSPEQAERNQLDVDTRSDVYSLGIVLYELLTGETPFGRERLQTAGFDETLRIIREEEPIKPSAKIGSSQSLQAVAANRRVEPARLSTLIRGELDWVVMKSLEKDRGRRYESAGKFAEDVENYLNGAPVEAAAPSTGYRIRKFARRHKVSIVVASIMVFLLVGGIAATSWQAVLATQEKVRANNEKNRAVAAEALAQLRLEESEKARAQSEKDRRAAVAAQESTLAARKETSDISRSLCDLLVATGNYHESMKVTTSKDNILLTWAASDPKAAVKWYKEKLASGELIKDSDNKQHQAVFHHLMLGLIASNSNEDIDVYASTPKELRPERGSINNPTEFLITKYVQKLVNDDNDSGIRRLLESTDGLVQQSIVHSAVIQFARSGKLDNGLKFLDNHMPKPWAKGLYPKQPHMSRDEHVSAMAASTAGLDTKGRLDWLIANSSSVPDNILAAAKKTPPVTVDTSPVVKAVGLEYRPQEDHMVSQMKVNRKDYENIILPQLYQNGPPDGTRLFLFLTSDSRNFVTHSGDCKLTSFTDSTGKNLIKDSPEPIYIDNGMDKGWFQFEGLRAIRSTGDFQGYKIDSLLPPSDGSTHVMAKGMLGAKIATRKQTVKTSPAIISKGAIFKSDDIEFEIKKLEPSGFQRIGRSKEEFEQFLREYPTQMQVTFAPARISNILLTSPSINRAYVGWRFIEKSGKVHDLVSSGGASWSKHDVVNQGEIELAAKEPLTEGSFEVEFWTDFKTVKVPFEVKFELDGEKVEVKDYDQRIRKWVGEDYRKISP